MKAQCDSRPVVVADIVRWLIKKQNKCRPKSSGKDRTCRGPRTCVPVADDDLAGDVELHSITGYLDRIPYGNPLSSVEVRVWSDTN